MKTARGLLLGSAVALASCLTFASRAGALTSDRDISFTATNTANPKVEIVESSPDLWDVNIVFTLNKDYDDSNYTCGNPASSTTLQVGFGGSCGSVRNFVCEPVVVD